MRSLLERHADRIAGVLSCYDRIIIQGTLIYSLDTLRDTLAASNHPLSSPCLRIISFHPATRSRSTHGVIDNSDARHLVHSSIAGTERPPSPRQRAYCRLAAREVA